MTSHSSSEVYLAVTDGLECANRVKELLEDGQRLQGYMKIESLNCYNHTSKFIFEVVSEDQEYLESILTLAEEHVTSSVSSNKEPDAKLALKSAVGTFPSERQDKLKLLLPFHIFEGKGGLKALFTQAVHSSKPSGLGRSSDSYVSGHPLSPPSSTLSRSNEEEEE